jgi:putative CocE/NonD family hydrolase
VYYPTDPATGQRAAGPFPVIMTQTPYGKGLLGAAPGAVAAQTGPNYFLIKRGFIDVVADVRGTGDSQGAFGLFDPVQDTDGVTLVNWAAGLPGSSGKVGLYGASYLGIDQLLTAGKVGKNSPLKAIFPIVSANDIYQDTATMGGLIDLEFDAFYLALTGGLNVTNPIIEALQNPKLAVTLLNPALLQHIADLGTFDAAFTAQTLAGKAGAYDDTYWHDRNPVNVLQNIVDNGIPAYLVGGEYDLFQRGEAMNYAGFQNAWAGRSVTAPMRPTQQATGRYQLLDGPFAHLTGSTVDVSILQLEWFDTWLKGENTGMDRTPTPLHYYDLGTNTYAEHAQYPFPEATATRYYFSGTRSHTAPLNVGDRSLSLTPPSSTGSDTILWSPVGNPCGRPTDQWSAGGASLVAGYLAPNAPCIYNDVLGQIGLDRITYTSPQLTTAQTIAGPIDVTVYAKANTKETQLVAEVEDVAPNGTSVPLTEGALLGSLRAQDPAQTWTDAAGQTMKPGHSYASASSAAVPKGAVTRYDIEVFPTYATIAAGHRIRVTLSTADTPHLAPTLPELVNLLGGIYAVQRSAAAPSAVELQLIPAG